MIKDPSKFSPTYCHKLSPMAHQGRVFQESWDREYYGLFWEMGTGKSKTLIDSFTQLFLKQELDGVLIVSDKGSYLNWFYDLIPTHMMDGIPYRMAYYRAGAKKAERIKYELLMTAEDDLLDILVMNVECFSGEKGADVAEKFLRNHWSMVIVDESTSIKNHKSERSKTLIRLGQLASYRRIASGTPVTEGPEDLYGQCQFLKPGCLGYTSFVAFSSTYIIKHQIDLGGGRKFDKTVGYRNLDQLNASIQGFTSRILKSECLDLPEKIYETYYVEWTPEQEQAYNSLKDTAVLQLSQGLITATSALSIVMKLHQINCGHIKDDDGNIISIPSNRLQTLVDLMKATGPRKTVIWCAFQEDVRQIMAALSEAFPEKTGVHYYGETHSNDRPLHVDQFRNDPDYLWFVGTGATGGKALTLTEANQTIYYSNTYKLETRLQTEDRVHRYGQKNNCTYFDLVVPRSIDVKILKALLEKRDLAREVLDRNQLQSLLT